MEEGYKQADGIFHSQDDTEAPEGALEDIFLTEGCVSGREGGGMSTLGDGLSDGGNGPLRYYLDREAMGGVLLKKRGGMVACRGGRRSDSCPLGRCDVFQENGVPSYVNTCCICIGKKGVGGCCVCACRARGGRLRGGARGGCGVSGEAEWVGFTSAWGQDRYRRGCRFKRGQARGFRFQTPNWRDRYKGLVGGDAMVRSLIQGRGRISNKSVTIDLCCEYLPGGLALMG